MAYRVTVTPHARRDLDAIWLFIAAENPEAADALTDRLLAEAASLQSLPARAPIWRAGSIVRKLVVGPYVIFYQITEAERLVEILRFWHSARNRRGLRLRESPPTYSSVT